MVFKEVIIIFLEDIYDILKKEYDKIKVENPSFSGKIGMNDDGEISIINGRSDLIKKKPTVTYDGEYLEVRK